jgi:MFS family permease
MPEMEGGRPVQARARGLARLRDIYHEYPRQFWVLVLGTFVDRLGGALLFPFFTLYITRKFGVGMTEVGLLFALFAVAGVVGSVVGGALADRLGRKSMFLFGLVTSALSSLFMGLVDSLVLFFVATLLVGLLAESAGPARQAMVADLLPEEQRAQGFGIVRVVVNLAVTIGPMIGGLLAAQSYLLLFVSDAVASLITAAIVYLALQETRPDLAEGEATPGVAGTFGGYLDVLRDAAFAWFLAASVLAVLVYMQMNTTLAVYLRDSHGVSEQGYGYILSLNAAMVVLFQFPITRWLGRFRPLAVMAAGTLFYAVGFALYGFVSAYWLFLVAMVVITIGEMFTSPTAQAIVARLAPGDMRGRYMAVYGFSWVVPVALGPLLAGLVMDNADPRWVWYGAGLVGLVAAGAYYLLQWQVRRAGLAAVDRRLAIVARLEEDEITAEQAAELLREVDDGKLATLGPAPAEGEARRVRVRITDLATGAMKADLSLPLGLVNTILYTGGRLAAGLEGIDAGALQELVARSAAGEGAQVLEGDGPDQIEISVE